MKVVCCAALLASASGCPRMRRLRAENARLDALATLSARVEAEHWSGEPLVLVVMRKPTYPGAPIAIARRVPLDAPGTYSVILPPGAYLLGAFEDRNRNGRYDRDAAERAGVFQDLAEIDLRKPPVHKSFGLTITDQLPAALRQLTGAKFEEQARIGEGDVVPLADARFEPDNAQMGLWQPATFHERIGMGVFMLEPYDAERIPVLFVHGMGGHPREFESLIDCLDKTRFQPWVVQYASGWRLGPLARGLNYALTTLQRRHGFSQLYVVAHSMGGLVSRGALREHLEHTTEPFITKFVTLCSPLGGMPSADRGVELAPAVVPAWRDIGPLSEYVKHLYERPLPAQVEYSLFFAYDDDDTDGVVGLSSQLRHEAQREAVRMMGFETTHVGVLKDSEVCRELEQVLARPAAPIFPSAAPIQ